MLKQTFLIIALSLLAADAAQAQTWRIAHASHSGSSAEVRSGNDNFGLPYRKEWPKDSVAARRGDTAASPAPEKAQGSKTRKRKHNNSAAPRR